MDYKKLEQKLAQAELQIARLHEQKRKLDAQMKIIIGACVINECKKNPDFLRMIERVTDTNASERDKKRLAGFRDWITEQAAEKSSTEQTPPRTTTPFFKQF